MENHGNDHGKSILNRSVGRVARRILVCTTSKNAPFEQPRTKGKQQASTPLPSIIASSLSFSETKDFHSFGESTQFAALRIDFLACRTTSWMRICSRKLQRTFVGVAPRFGARNITTRDGSSRSLKWKLVGIAS
jgi:hypothetical protein